MTFNLQFSILTTKPLSRVVVWLLRLSQSLRFLDLNICVLSTLREVEKHFYVSFQNIQLLCHIVKVVTHLICFVGYDHSCLGIS